MSLSRSAVLISFATVSLLCSCGADKGNGNVVAEQRTLKSFDQVTVSDGLTVNIVNGAQRVTVTTDQDLQNNIVTDVDGTTLKIRLAHNGDIAPTTATIEVSTPTLTELKVSGKSSVTAEGTQASKWNLEVYENSRARVTGIGAATLDADVKEESQVEISGQANELKLGCHDASSVNASQLNASKAVIDISGKSQANVFVTNDIKIDSDGNSRVFVTGNPATRNVHADKGSEIVFSNNQ